MVPSSAITKKNQRISGSVFLVKATYQYYIYIVLHEYESRIYYIENKMMKWLNNEIVKWLNDKKKSNI